MDKCGPSRQIRGPFETFILHKSIIKKVLSYYKETKDGHRQPRTLFTFVTYLLGRFWTDFNEIW